MFSQKREALKAKGMIRAQSAQLATAIGEACRTVQELQIPQEKLLEAKIQKLVIGIHDAKAQVAKVQFKLNMKIIELELRSQLSTPPKFREQRKAVVKEGIATMDDVFVNFTTLFEQAMEVVTTMQEDPTMQILNTNIYKL